jgi:hypothetical protein
VPRLYAEMGGRAELRHNPAGAARKALILVGTIGLCWLALRRRGKRHEY